MSLLRTFLARFDRCNICNTAQKGREKITSPEQLQISFPHPISISPCFRHQLRHLVDPDLRTVMRIQVWRNSKWCQQCRRKIKKNLVKRSPWGSQKNRVPQVSQNKELRSPYPERNDWLFLCYFENLFILKQQLFNKQNMHCIMHKQIPSNWKSCKMQFIINMQIKKMVIFLLLVKYSFPLTYMFV